MSVKTKAVGAAKAGIAVAAPEAAVAEGAVAKTASAAAAKKAAAKPAAAPAPGPPAPSAGSPSAGLATTPVALPKSVSGAANAGGGFVLGLMAYAVGLAYLRGGPAEVKRLLAAKFLNKTSPAGGGS